MHSFNYFILLVVDRLEALAEWLAYRRVFHHQCYYSPTLLFLSSSFLRRFPVVAHVSQTEKPLIFILIVVFN